MRHITALMLAAGAAATSLSPATAADRDGNFAIRGIGAQTCAVVVEAIEQADSAQRAQVVGAFSTWLGGYLTFANRTADARFDASPFVSDIDMLAIVVDRCEAAPDALFETAAHDIFTILEAFGPAEASPVVALEDAVVLRTATIAALQQALIDKGFLAGRADGEIGPRSRDAIARFNAEQGLDIGSVVSIETVLRAFAEE